MVEGTVASCRRSVSWGAARKTAREKKKREERKRINAFFCFYFFARYFSNCAPTN